MKLMKLLTVLLTLCLVSACFVTVAQAADGENSVKAIQLVTNGTLSGVTGGQASSVWFGNYWQSSADSKEPIQWRVLSNADGELFLLSDKNLDAAHYNTEDTSVTWKTSSIRSWLSYSFLGTAFAAKEQIAVAETSLTNDDNQEFNTEGGADTTDKLFLLSIAEAKNKAYGFTDSYSSTATRQASNTDYAKDRGVLPNDAGYGYWWLRSPGEDDKHAAVVSWYGDLIPNGNPVYDIAEYPAQVGVRPAFHLNLNAVLFTSAAAGGKAGDGALTAIGSYSGSDWKLTLLDASRNFSAGFESRDGDVWTISYSGAETGTNEYISAVIVNSDGEATHYGRLAPAAADPNEGTNTVTVNLAGKLGDGDTLYVFNEQCNGDYRTDYASAFESVTLTVATVVEPVTPKTDADGTYLITDYAELKGFAKLVNDGAWDADARLMNSFTAGDRQWTPIGTANHGYKGAFDGQGNAITGLNNSKADPAPAYAGLFANIDSGTVKDVEIKDCTLIASGSGDVYAGGIAGDSEGTVENCKVSGASTVTITGGGHVYAGGIVGYSKGTVNDCLRDGTAAVSAVSDAGYKYPYAGGIVGFNSTGTVENCESSGTGNVTASGGTAARAGGVVGWNSGGLVDFDSNGTVSGCFFTGSGTVEAKSTSIASVGGIVGTNSDGTVEQCAFTGSAALKSSGSEDSYIGGIVGYNKHSGSFFDYDYFDAVVKNCEVSGSGSITASGSGARAGGVVGWNDSGIAENCCASVGATGGATGGVVGSNKNGTVTACYYDLSRGTAATAVGGEVDTENVRGLPAADYRTQSTFTTAGWDFSAIWKMSENGPVLRKPGEVPTTYTVTVTPGTGMSLTSGSASQAVNVGSAMTDVIYQAADGYYFPTDYSVEAKNGVTVTRNSYAQITVSGKPTADAAITLTAAAAKTKEQTPSAVFTATGPDTGTLSNVTAGMTYAVDGGTPTAIAGTSVDLTGLAPCTITVVRSGNGTTTADSDPQTIAVTKADAPTEVGKADCTTLKNNDGKLTGVTAAMEYKASDADTWTTGTGGDVTGLVPGTYLVRVKAAGTVLASDEQSIEISKYVPTQEQTPNATFTATGPDTGTLSNVTAGMTYAIDGGTVVEIKGTSVDLTGLAPCTIKVVRPGNGTTTVESDPQTITVTKAETPNLTATQPTAALVTGSIPTDSTHQIRKDGETWTDCAGETSGLAPGMYYVRVKAAGTVLASDEQKITINKVNIQDAEITLGKTLTYTGEEQTQTVKVTLDGVVITEYCDVTGNTRTDASEDYEFTVTAKENSSFTGSVTMGFNIAKANVTVTAASAVFTYNGTAQSDAGYTVEGLFGSDAITAVVTGSITFPSERSVTNKVESYEFTSGSADNYTVSTIDGKLTMNKAAASVTITAGSGEWTYDGGTHENKTVSVSSGSLFTDDELKAEATGSVKNAADTKTGNNPVAAGYKILHGGEDVTENYVITAEPGTLTINPLTGVTVTITGKNNTTVYDKKEHTVSGYDAKADNNLYDVTKDFTFTGTAEAKQTAVGTANMNLVAGQFENTNPNFTGVTFTVTDGYQTITEADKTALDQAIDDAEKYVEKIKDTHPEIAEKLKEAIDKAKAVSKKENVTEAEVAAALNELEEALKAAKDLAANKDEFEQIKKEAVSEIGDLLEPNDSAACVSLINRAIRAINELVYDEDLSLDENIDRILKIVSDLEKDLAAQRKRDYDYARSIEAALRKGRELQRKLKEEEAARKAAEEAEKKAAEEAAKKSALPFTDVEPFTNLYDIVKYVYDNGIMNGVSETKFDPFGTLTRGMIVTILYRMEGEPAVPYTGAFTDVPDGTWYTDGVEWAASKGIVLGYGNGKYGPTDEVTREQLAAILYRYAQLKGYAIETDELDAADKSLISAWAVENVKWAVANDVLWVSNGTIRPTEKALRWEVAVAVRAFLEGVAK